MCSRACFQEGVSALLADDADGDRERIRGGGPRTDHGRIGELVGACSGLRIKNVMEMPGRLERRAVASGYRECHVITLDDAVNPARRQRILDTDPPRMAIRVPAQGMEFAEIDYRRFEAFVAQHVGDGVGDEALGDAVEGYAHAFTRERDTPGARLDAAEIDQFARHVLRAGDDVRY